MPLEQSRSCRPSVFTFLLYSISREIDIILRSGHQIPICFCKPTCFFPRALSVAGVYRSVSTTIYLSFRRPSPRLSRHAGHFCLGTAPDPTLDSLYNGAQELSCDVEFTPVN